MYELKDIDFLLVVFVLVSVIVKDWWESIIKLMLIKYWKGKGCYYLYFWLFFFYCLC